jgi:acetoacetyl-CoA synthetase
MSDILWQPDPQRIAQANVTRLRKTLEQKHRIELVDYATLYQWSIDKPELFWRALWDFAGVIGSPGERVLINGEQMPGAQWFPDAQLNFAENLLRRQDDAQAIVFWGEDKVKRTLSYRQLYDQVSQLAQALRALGVKSGDRVAGYLPNMPETIMAMLAATSVGAIWSSCSPDFGVRGVLDRFGQIEPKVLFCANGYYYNGKSHDSLEKLKEILAELPTVEQVVVIPYTREQPPLGAIDHALTLWPDFIASYIPAEIDFQRMPFNHPLYIMFSSGTTGVPKCIVHGVGGTLLKHLCEHLLHTDIKPGERLFYFTTCGWMMWNWQVSGLAAEATLLLYDGSPFYPSGNILFDYADAENMTIFGTSAKFIDAVNKGGLEPAKSHSLSSVKTMLSTGSPLVPESFDFVYQKIKTDLCLASIAGGTDIVGCFVLGNPVLPVYRGEIQCRGLGLKVEVWDDDGRPLLGEKGELVCTAPFPSMPVGFWNDPDGARYRAAYFERFPSVWCHGDYVALSEHGGMIIYGRSDAVLNPGGVRIGTAEIYRQVEQLSEVVEALVIGQDWDNDVRVVLFVRLQPGHTLDENLIKKIKTQIRQNATPRHVPAKIVEVSDIPRTKSGKIVELAVREVVHNRPVKNQEALANPEALALFKNRPELSVD